jgi:hypothetical protein
MIVSITVNFPPISGANQLPSSAKPCYTTCIADGVETVGGLENKECRLIPISHVAPPHSGFPSQYGYRDHSFPIARGSAPQGARNTEEGLTIVDGDSTMATQSLPRFPRTVNFSSERALAYYCALADKFRKHAELTHCICPRDARKARDLAQTYDHLADACEPKQEVQS